MRHIIIVLALLLVSCGGGSVVLPPDDTPDPPDNPPVVDPADPTPEDAALLAAVEARLVKTDVRTHYTYQVPPETGIEFGRAFTLLVNDETVYCVGFGTIDSQFNAYVGVKMDTGVKLQLTGKLLESGVIRGTLPAGQSVSLYPMRNGIEDTQAEFEAEVLVPYP